MDDDTDFDLLYFWRGSKCFNFKTETLFWFDDRSKCKTIKKYFNSFEGKIGIDTEFHDSLFENPFFENVFSKALVD